MIYLSHYWRLRVAQEKTLELPCGFRGKILTLTQILKVNL